SQEANETFSIALERSRRFPRRWRRTTQRLFARESWSSLSFGWCSINVTNLRGCEELSNSRDPATVLGLAKAAVSDLANDSPGLLYPRRSVSRRLWSDPIRPDGLRPCQ